MTRLLLARRGRYVSLRFLPAGILCALLLIGGGGKAQQKEQPAATPQPQQSTVHFSRQAPAQAEPSPVASPQKRKPVAASQSRAQAGEGAAEFRDDNPGARERWFYEQRAYPLGYIPSGARLRAFERAREMRRERSVLFRAVPGTQGPPLSTTTWTSIGPQPTNTSSQVGNVAGRVSAVAVDPLNPDILYVGGAQGGVWKSTDAGNNWTPLTDDEASLAIGAIAIDPTNPQIVYVGTGEQTNSIGSYYGAGILKSTDGGANWTQLAHQPGSVTPHASCPVGSPTAFAGPFSAGFSPGGGARISSIAIRPGNPNVLLAGVLLFISQALGSGGCSSGIYRSTDAGVSWTEVLPGGVGSEVLFDPTNGMIAYAALGTTGSGGTDPDNGIYKSTDGGVTWSRQTLPGTVTQSSVGRIEIAIAPSQTSTLYASIENVNTGGLLAFLRTTNGGTNWTSLGVPTPVPDFCTAQCWYDHVIRVHPTNPNVIYAGGAATAQFFAVSTDGGNSWTARQFDGADRLHVDIQAMQVVTTSFGSRLVVGNDGGVWRADLTNSTDAPNWINLNANLGMMQFYPGHSIHPTTPDIGYGGTQDNGTQKYDFLVLGTTWQGLSPCGDGGWTVIDPLSPNTVYAACQNVDINKSTNAGGGFASADAGITTSDRSAFIPPLVMDLAMPQRLYFGTCRVWQTMNSASSWSAISPDLTAAASGTSCPTVSGEPSIRTLAVAPTDSNVLYAGTSDGRVVRTTMAGLGTGALNTWSLPNTSDVPNRVVTMVAVHPTNPDIAFATFSGFSGFSGDNKGHVFRTTTGGAAWTDISGNLPNIPVNDIVVDPDAAQVGDTLYVGTDVGVFATTDGGMIWFPLANGFPNVAVLGLKLHRPTRTLRAGTHGRGMWDIDVSSIAAPTYLLSSLNPNSAAAGSGALTLTVNGIGFTMSSEVRWNGQMRTTTFVSASQLTAQISAGDVASTGFAQVAVFDPDPAKQTSNSLTFTINPGPPPNDDFANAIQVSATPFTSTVNSTAATNEPGDPMPQATAGCPASSGFGGGSGSGHTVWWRVTPTADVVATVSTAGSNYDSVLSVWTGSGLGSLVQVNCDDDGVAAGGASRLTGLALSMGTTYHFMVSGFASTNSGTTVFNFDTPLDFAVSANPGAVTVARGQTSAAITVTVTPVNGAFTTAIVFSCTGLPALSTCVFNPTSVMPGSNPATTQLTITTTAPGMAPGAPQSQRWTPPPLVILTLALLAMTLAAAGSLRSRTRRRPGWAIASALGAVVILAGLSVSCGGGGGTPPTPQPNPGTPTGTFTVSVRGTSGATVRTTNVTLTVQ